MPNRVTQLALWILLGSGLSGCRGDDGTTTGHSAPERARSTPAGSTSARKADDAYARLWELCTRANRAIAASAIGDDPGAFALEPCTDGLSRGQRVEVLHGLFELEALSSIGHFRALGVWSPSERMAIRDLKVRPGTFAVAHNEPGVATNVPIVNDAVLRTISLVRANSDELPRFGADDLCAGLPPSVRQGLAPFRAAAADEARSLLSRDTRWTVKVDDYAVIVRQGDRHYVLRSQWRVRGGRLELSRPRIVPLER